MTSWAVEIITRSLYNVKGERLPLVVLLILFLFKFYRLDGGINLGEPDEFIHADVARNFYSGLAPRFSGGYWFFELPLYPFLGYLTSLLFPGRYLGLRIVSVVFSVLLTLGMYLYLKRKVSKRVGFFSALIFVLSPMGIYYSRLGLLDMGTTAMAMLFLFSLDLMVVKKNWVWGLWCGLFLGLAVLIKYSALMYLPLLVLYFFWRTLRVNTLNWDWQNLRRKFGEIKFLELETSPALALITVFLLVAPLAWILRQFDPYNFKLQLLTSLGFIKDFWRIKGGELTLWRYGIDVIWWVSWPIFVLALLGVSSLWERRRTLIILVLGLTITLFFVVPHTPFYPRYFFPLIPFLVIFAGFGLDFLLTKLTTFLDPTGLKTTGLKTLWRSLFLVLFLILLLPSGFEAWQASQHGPIEKVGAFIRAQKKVDNPWIFTNYWPNYFNQSVGSGRATWLTTSTWDAGAYVKDIGAAPPELLEKEGGFVVLERLYSTSPIFIQNRERREAWRMIGEKYQPAVTVSDNSPNFPHFKTKINKIFVYEINPE